MLFPYDTGVRLGENLSPLLFSIYLNDLEQFLSQSGNVNGVTCSSNNIEENAHILLKLFVMPYADDIVILAETADDLQNALTQYVLYCDTWKVNINNSKTEIVIFARGRLPDYRFRLIEEIEIVPNYKYLGVMFNRTGSFLATKRHIASQANSAVFCLLKKAKNLLLPTDIQIEMFLKTGKPILLYACKICGHGNVDILKQVQLKFFKSILNLKNLHHIALCMVKLEFCPLNLIYRLALSHFGRNLFFLFLTIYHLNCMRYLYLIIKTIEMVSLNG